MDHTPKRVVIVGATSAMAEHCARLWLQQDAEQMVLLGRNAEKLDRLAKDLVVRNPQSHISTRTCDFLSPAAIHETVRAILREGDAVDTVLIAHGHLPDQEQCQENLHMTAHALLVNGVSPVLFAEAFAMHMAQQPEGGTIGVIGSVAGDRGRKSNYVYGAGKSMVGSYVQGMQHRFAHTPLRLVLIKPGPTDTPMTEHLKEQGPPMASVEQVAADIVRAMAKGRCVIYTPGKWRIIMAVIRALPRFIFHKMNI